MINSAYSNEVIEEVKQSFNSHDMKHVMLQSFFDEESYSKLINCINNCKRTGVKIADRYSYSLIEGDNLSKFFDDKLNFMIEKIVGKKIKEIKIDAREFGWKDYTLLHDSENKDKGLDIFLFICRENWDYFWGGNVVYKSKEGKSHIFTPVPNSLCIVSRRKEDMSFIQYLNHYVGDEKVIVLNLKLE